MKTSVSKISFLILWALTGSAWASVVLDQGFASNSNQGSVVSAGANMIHAQTFTSGLTGELAQIDLFVTRFLGMPTNDLNVMILDTTPLGVPDSQQTLATLSLPPTDVPAYANFGGTFFSIDVSAFHIPVLAGDSLAIAVQTNEPYAVLGLAYSWEITANNPYAGGNLFISNDSGTNFYPTGEPAGSSDVGFRTYVNTSPVPEPTTYIMMLIGLGFISFVIRSRRNIAS